MRTADLSLLDPYLVRERTGPVYAALIHTEPWSIRQPYPYNRDATALLVRDVERATVGWQDDRATRGIPVITYRPMRPTRAVLRDLIAAAASIRLAIGDRGLVTLGDAMTAVGEAVGADVARIMLIRTTTPRGIAPANLDVLPPE